MSSQAFTLEQRYAIWQVHDGRCFYDGEPVAFNDMEIDHLVPESYAEKPADRRVAAFSALSLPADYDVRGYYNLVPACGRCNGRKSDRILRPQHIWHSLAITEPLIERIQKAVQSQLAGKTLTKVLWVIQLGLDKGNFTPEQLLDALDEMGLTRTALAETGTAFTEAGDIAEQDIPPASDIMFLNIKAAADVINLKGVGRLLSKIANGEVSGERVENNGTPMYVVSADGLYIKYRVEKEQLLVVSCHLG
jgi:hypothetical protein